MPDAQGNERFCFRVPADFMICINAPNLPASWQKLKVWLEAHQMSLVTRVGSGEAADFLKLPLPELALIVATMNDAPVDSHQDIGLNVHCHEIHLEGYSLPGKAPDDDPIE